MASNIDNTLQPHRRAPKYPPTSREQLQAILAYGRATLLFLEDRKANPKPDPSSLVGLPPYGSISEITHDVRDFGDAMGVRIGDRSLRFTVPLGVLILVVLCMFGGVPFIDKDRKGGSELHYVEVAGPGFTWHRLMAGAGAGEAVRLVGKDHYQLFPSCFRIVGDPRAIRDRTSAVTEALRHYDTVAQAWGLSDLLSRQEYEALMWDCFRMFDAEYGGHIRPKAPITAA